MKILSLILCLAVLLSGCAPGSGTTVATVTVPETTAALSVEAPAQPEDAAFTDLDLDGSYSEEDSVSIVLSRNEILCDSSDVTVSGTTATIEDAGTYLLTGTLENGSIVVDAEKSDKIQLVLKDVSIHSETSAAIYIRQADKVFVTLADGSENSLSNGGSFTADEDANIDSVIFSKDDLTLNGSGALSITSPGGHGIVSKDSLRITGGTYAIDAASHALSGQDEVSIAGGQFDLVAGKDGIHAESEDADTGTVYLEGGIYRITAQGDGVSASGSCRIADGSYTITAGGGHENAAQRATAQSFGPGNRGGGKPAMEPAAPQSGQPQDIPQPAGERGSMGKGMDRGNKPDMPKEGQDSSAQQTDSVSRKGIKASSLFLDGGSFTIDTADDGLHSNGNLTIQGGTLEIASGDDGIHADETVLVTSGSIRISDSYEGIEGQHVKIQGGEITLTASDDGLNAAGGVDASGFGRGQDTFRQSDDTPSILISGGAVTITASGDGIDANGTLSITGGAVSVTGPTQGDTSVLDYDISGTISGGTFFGTGAASMVQSLTGSGQGVICINAGSQCAGTQVTLTDSSGTVLLSQTPALDYELVILSAPSIHAGESYTLDIGGATQTLTAQ